MYEKYAPYIQSQLPDVNIQFVVGNNDLDFYKFLNENGQLPDIITCCRFSLHDAAPLKDSLMDLSTTSEAGAIYDSYLQSFTNEDGSVNWLPMCADVHGFITNKALFDQYNIPLPTDYESFVSACQAFEKAGIRGYVGDYAYDYTCMETLQGVSIPELTSMEGRKWRTAYSDPASTDRVGLDDAVWPGVFEQMEQFIRDVNLTPDVLEFGYDAPVNIFANGEVAMISGSSARVGEFRDRGIDTVILPYFGQNGEQWLMTTPYLQVALNRDLEKDEARREKAMRVLDVMISEEGQTLLPTGQDVLSYSQDVGIHLTDCLESIRPLIEQNRMYIRIASNDFFSASRDVVQKMITGEYNAQKAYEAFDAQLREPKDVSTNVVLTSENTYSNVFHSKGGNEAYSVMANTLRGCYGTGLCAEPRVGWIVKQTPGIAGKANTFVIDDQVNKFHRTVAGTPCGGVFCCSMLTGQPERILPHKTFSSNGGKKSVQDPPVLTVSGLDARFSATMGKADGYFVDTQTNFDFFSVDDILYIRIL